MLFWGFISVFRFLGNHSILLSLHYSMAQNIWQCFFYSCKWELPITSGLHVPFIESKLAPAELAGRYFLFVFPFFDNFNHIVTGYDSTKYMAAKNR